MNLHEYYKNEKDNINSDIMEIACDLALFELCQKYNRAPCDFIEIDPQGDGEMTHYIPKFQDEFDIYYDEAYDKIAQLMKFDLMDNDGILKQYTLINQ